MQNHKWRKNTTEGENAVKFLLNWNNLSQKGGKSKRKNIDDIGGEGGREWVVHLKAKTCLGQTPQLSEKYYRMML